MGRRGHRDGHVTLLAYSLADIADRRTPPPPDSQAASEANLLHDTKLLGSRGHARFRQAGRHAHAEQLRRSQEAVDRDRARGKSLGKEESLLVR